MSASNGQISRPATWVYEEFFVPALFGEWAPRLADKLGPIGHGQVLDVACGTGVLARELARRASPDRVCALDCNADMLSVAAEVCPGIKWQLGHAEALPFDAHRFTGVTSQFGLMFFEDPVQALSEMWRVLKQGGHLAVAVWGALTDTPGYQSMVQLLDEALGAAIADELKVPFCLGSPQLLQDLFSRAGIPRPKVETVVGAARFPSIEAWVHTDVRGWTLAERIDDAQYALVRHKATAALAPYVQADGSVAFASPAHIISAEKT